MQECRCSKEAANLTEQRNLLRLLLALNFSMFIVEAVAGLIADSSGLLADSLDMLADASVYMIALYAVGRSDYLKATAASVSGVSQILLAILVMADVYRRTAAGSDPEPVLIIGIGGVALAVNVICMLLLRKHRDGEIHMRASWLFSANDVLVNIGLIISGTLVGLLGQSWPDLVFGFVISAIVIRSGLHIFMESRSVRRDS